MLFHLNFVGLPHITSLRVPYIGLSLSCHYLMLSFLAGLLILGLVCIGISALWLNAASLLLAVGQDPDVARLAAARSCF